ncbi:MAG TPA: alpha/beta hydrolase [Gemmataceae bacterium]|nr:alpha/beta hydrolase [Gemmataceae bacterium]
MPPSPLLRSGAACLLAALAVPPVAAAEAGKLLPGDTDVVVTLNVRRFLDDHRDTEAVRHYLEQWRLAQRGDEKRLRAYYRERDVRNIEGLTEEQFLERARAFRDFSDALGVDLLQDVDRVTFGFKVGDADSLVVLVEGRFKEKKVRAALRRAGQPVDPAQVSLLSARVLAVTAHKDRMDGVRAAVKKGGGLSLAEQTLLDGVAEEHLAVAVNHLDVLRTAAVKSLEEEVVPALPPGDGAARAVVTRLLSWLRDDRTDYAAAAFGLSVGPDDLRLQVALEARKAADARELRAQVGQVTFGAALALKAAGGTELSRQLADVLRGTRVSGRDTRVVVRARVPHECTRLAFLAGWKALQGPGDVALRRVMSVRLWGPVPQPPGALNVAEVPDVAYRDGPQADPIRHRSDLFLPRGKKGFPVVVLVHGGAWVLGDNRCCGLYSSVGHFLASQGYGVVLPNYRPSPAVRHPAHVRDVAGAVAWTRRHIAEHGGDPRRIYLLGHSAGGHLVSLLATDESYLKAEGLTAADVKGVIAVSGVYRIPPGDVRAVLGGRGPRGHRFEQMFPLRGDAGRAHDCPLPGVPVRLDVFGLVFGAGPKERARASPVNHVRRGLPPFLLLTAANDLPTLQDMADEFHRTLLRAGCQAQRRIVERRNHNSALFSAIRPDDPTARAVLDFLRQQNKEK